MVKTYQAAHDAVTLRNFTELSKLKSEYRKLQRRQTKITKQQPMQPARGLSQSAAGGNGEDARTSHGPLPGPALRVGTTRAPQTPQ